MGRKKLLAPRGHGVLLPPLWGSVNEDASIPIACAVGHSLPSLGGLIKQLTYVGQS